MIDRRRFLGGSAAATALAASAAPAAAFRIEPAPLAEAEALLAARAKACRISSDHPRILADVRTLLAGKSLPEPEKEKALAAASCPLCGCPLTPS